MNTSRVAVAPGRHVVRIAGAADACAPRLLAELPAGSAEPATALAGLIGTDAEEVVLVYPPGRAAAPVQAWLAAAAAVTPRVRRVAGPVAAAAGTGARAVLDVGRSGSEATLLHADRIVARRSSGIGGDRLDLAVRALLRDASLRDAPLGDASLRDASYTSELSLADVSVDDARRVREALSLLPVARHGAIRVDAEQLRRVLTPLLDEAVAVLGEVVAVAGEPVAVLLTGGVARCPLLAERVDAAGFAAEVLVAPRPDLAAVLGALTLPYTPVRSAQTRSRAGPVSGPLAGAERSSPGPSVGAEGSTPGPPAGAGRPSAEPPEEGARGSPPPPPVPRPGPEFLPAARATRRARRWASAAATALLVGGVAGAGTAAVVPMSAPPAAAAPVVGSGVLVQYGYRLDLPPGWAHTGGLPERRRSLLTRVAAPDGTDLIAVERTPLGYDADSEPERAATELRTQFDRAVAAGSTLSRYGSTRIGGRAVTTYVQQERAGAVVEWFVVLDGDAQLSVGCRHTPSGTTAVRAACAVVVDSIRRT
ncbi:MAG TPA: type VII secretion-associated protein [Pseudonocardia sp.]